MRCKKILLGFGSSWFSTEEIDFVAQNLAGNRTLVAASFISNLSGVKIHKACGKLGCQASPACIGKKIQRDRTKISDYLNRVALEKNFQATIKKDQEVPLPSFLQESRFADLLVISQQTWRATTHKPKAKPVSEVLINCECPVLVVPEQIDAYEKVVITYDGTAEAMHGIKHFLYVLPELAKNLPVTVLATYCEARLPSANEERLFIEYLKQHFSEVALHKVNSQTENTLVRAVGINEKSLIIINNRSPKELLILNNILHPEQSSLAPVELFTSLA